MGAILLNGSANGSFTQYYYIPSITLTPEQTYLIQQGGQGLSGLINLINPNLIVTVVLGFDGSTDVGVGLGLALTSGKVALASNATMVIEPTASNVLDFVGYGLAGKHEGSGTAPSYIILNLISRTDEDTNNNSVDFTSTPPTPSHHQAH